MNYNSIVSDGDKYRKNYIDGINEFISRKNQEGFADIRKRHIEFGESKHSDK